MSLGQRIAGPISSILVRSRRRDKVDTVLKIVFLSLQVMDLMLTALAARYGWIELNPVMKASMDSAYKLALFKFAIPVVISYFVPGRWLIPAIMLLLMVVGWNVKELIMLAF
jgi:hypothetical protein